MSGTTTGARRVASGLAAALVLGVVTVVAVVVVLVVLGAVVPALGRVSQISTLVVPTLGPTLVVAGAVAAVLALVARRRLRRWGSVAAGLAGLGALAMAVIVGIVTLTAARAGGSIDLLRAVVPSSLAAAPGERVVYARTADGQELHAVVYRPASGASPLALNASRDAPLAPARAAPATPAPVLVYVHGGGWIRGTEDAAAGDMRWFAERGWVVVSVEYTLATPQRPTWDVAGPQVACALGWVGARAADLGGDPRRVALAGDSAGGQLAVSVGYAAATGTAVSSCGGPVPVPAAVAVQYPAVDPVGGYAAGLTAGGDLGLDARFFGRTYTGGSPDEVPERYRAISGETVVSPVAPPTLVIGPTRDDLVPFEGVARFVRAASAAGVDATLVEVPFANHGYDGLAIGSLGNQLRRTVTESWLRERVGLPGG